MRKQSICWWIKKSSGLLHRKFARIVDEKKKNVAYFAISSGTPDPGDKDILHHENAVGNFFPRSSIFWDVLVYTVMAERGSRNMIACLLYRGKRRREKDMVLFRVERGCYAVCAAKDL